MRRTLCFDDNWLFHLGDIPVEAATQKSPLYTQAKTESKRLGPAARDYLDQPEYYTERGLISHDVWQTVELPHDYVISQQPSPQNNGALGYFCYENAWYRKHFVLSGEECRVRLFFEAVATHCTVYVNGCYIMTHRCGYSSFEVDITDVVDFGADNVVAVYVDTTEHEGWWYEGAGIYRHVWLDLSDAVSVDCYGVFVHPEMLSSGHWAVPVDTELRNDGFIEVYALVHSAIVNENQETIAKHTEKCMLPPRKHGTVKQVLSVEKPLLWDVESPHLYTLVTTVYMQDTMVDKQETRFGFRTYHFGAEEGLVLNDRPVKIQGVCCHQDYGLTGKAVPERVQRYRLELLREMGANGYRCAHYPHHAYTMDMLDELGFLVLAETRWFSSAPEAMADLDMLVKRDRNHPSILFWSAGNEEPFHLNQAGRRITESMLHRMRELDGTRPVTTAVSHNPAKSPVLEAVDIVGVNYNLESWDTIHAMYPDKPFVSTECCATGTTRGWYFPDAPARGYVSGYDRDVNKSFLARERTWKAIMARPWCAGGYQWAGIEHRGETVWPRLCSQSGALDLFLQKKDAFYQNQSHWLKTPVLHLLPHWNWQGREGETISVWAYTNCSQVELFLNGTSLGIVAVEPYGHAQWYVPFVPGKLLAVGYQDGKIVCEDAVETTGLPVALALRLERGPIYADGRDVAIITCYCVDALGRFVPNAQADISFDTNGMGEVAATGSDVADSVPVTCPDRRMRAGLASVLVRAGKKIGILRVYARAQGLLSASLAIELQE